MLAMAGNGSARVLVVDDEAAVRTGLKLLLAGLGCEVLLAGGTEQALEVISGHRLDFVLRILLTYGLTLAVAGIGLALVDKLQPFDAPAVALKRMILVALPASFSATVVDSLR